MFVELVMSQIKSLRVQLCVIHVLYLSWFSSFTKQCCTRYRKTI